MEKKFIPKSLMKKIYSYNQGCDDITSKGKRCKNAFKYRYQDEVRDCGQYCASHCKDWMYDMLRAVIKGTLIVNGKVEKRGECRLILGNQKITITRDYYGNITRIYEYVPGSNRNLDWSPGKISLNDMIEEISVEFCKFAFLGIDIIIYVEPYGDIGKSKISDLEIGGIRGWTVNPIANNFMKKYKTEKDKKK